MSHSEKGQGAVEYALVLTLIAVVVIVVLALIGPAALPNMMIAPMMRWGSLGGDVIITTILLAAAAVLFVFWRRRQ